MADALKTILDGLIKAAEKERDEAIEAFADHRFKTQGIPKDETRRLVMNALEGRTLQ